MDSLLKIDELFRNAKKYSKSEEYRDLLKFLRKMRHLGPYNATLARIQRPGAEFLLPASSWIKKYHRLIKDDATPVVILQPFGPIELLFDLADTYPEDPEALNDDELKKFLTQFNPTSVVPEPLLNHLMSNLPKYGVVVSSYRAGAAAAAQIQPSGRPYFIVISATDKYYKNDVTYYENPAFYHINVSDNLSKSGVFASICHELGHLLCHHLAAPDNKLWQVRHISTDAEEFEAESVAAIVYDHFELDSTFAEKYLSGYVESHETIMKDVSPERIINAAGEIISLIQNPIKLKKSLLYKCSNDARRIIDSAINEYKVVSLWQANKD